MKDGNHDVGLLSSPPASFNQVMKIERSVFGAMVTPAWRWKRRPTHCDHAELSIDRFSHTGSDILSQEEGLGNLHNPSYSETGDLFVGNRWSGQGHDGGACGTLVGGGGYPTDVYRV